MKNLKFAIVLFIAVLGFTPAAEVKAQSVSVNFSLFQRELGPHGRWMTNPRFGEVWIYNDPGFKPYYTDGHWEYTNYGWSWVSDFDWGWAPFHYGRWEYDPSYGWMWIPGYDWGAAWVSWSEYDDYYGWAPLGYGVNVNVSFGSIPYDRWTFIPRRNICDRDINRYYVSPDRNRGFRNAVVINNYYGGNGDRGRFMRGPERNEVERYTHNNIQERRIDDRERQGRWTANNDNNRRDNGNNNNGGRRNDQQAGGASNNGNGNNNGRWGNRDGQVRGDNNNNPRDNGNNNGGRRNDQTVRADDQQRDQNFPGRKPNIDNNNGQPNRDINNPRQNDNRFPGNGMPDEKRTNRDNNPQGNFPQQQDAQRQQQQQIERQQQAQRQQQQQMERQQQDAQRQQQQQIERQQQQAQRQQQQQVERQQRQQQPAMEQRRDQGGQRSNGNGQGGNDNRGGWGKGRRG
ncbi:DUF6600 domain-containing protein [Ferruginibacter sp. SUN106]|uniref:DUF6600 domain-containing protein n=1 Tax=Ferruginibacter sp. SUN106 TaxID=2978348 RepID=UPI003D368722